jgi:hypothetical protein
MRTICSMSLCRLRFFLDFCVFGGNTNEQIVDGLIGLSRTGVDGVLLCWPRYEEGMRQFRDVTNPLIKQAGLRDFS